VHKREKLACFRTRGWGETIGWSVFEHNDNLWSIVTKPLIRLRFSWLHGRLFADVTECKLPYISRNSQLALSADLCRYAAGEI
jgi:hypothetical protein